MPIDTATVSVSNDAEAKARAGFASTQDAFDTLVTQLNERALFPDDVGTTGTGNIVYKTSPTLTTPSITGGTITSATLATPVVTGTLTSQGAIVAHSSTALPSGGATSFGIKISSTADHGLFWGTGAPSLSAANGSIYIDSSGTGTGDNIYARVAGVWTVIA